MKYTNPFFTLEVGGSSALRYLTAGASETVEIRWPRFEIDGELSGGPTDFEETGRVALTDHIVEISMEGALPCGARLGMVVRLCDESPFIRFRYTLSGKPGMRLTKTSGHDGTEYLSYASPVSAERTEVRLSGYDQLAHGYRLDELPAFRHEPDAMGPILAERRGGITFLSAYEHGSMYPDKFLAFVRNHDAVTLKALRGNYWDGQPVDERPYETLWLQFGAVAGSLDNLASAYRTFQLRWCSLNAESRKPYIFYNTWNYQERNRAYRQKPYLDSMNHGRMETEIEIAHKMGVDVFVIDTGWFLRTGDWTPNPARFPDGMARIRQMLKNYGMKLGLWFNPTAAAVSSEILARHRKSIMWNNGKETDAHPVWETEESHSLCLVDGYWDTFADELIRVARELDVRYFKWDAVDSYGCESGAHGHGEPGSPVSERRDCYAFQMIRALTRTADKVCRAFPDAIVDMDVTEGGRCMGLGFLSAGKFFAINNGPYYSSYDVPVPKDGWFNLFFHPGPARTWICRKGLSYDKWIPSVLFMCHYLPDDPAESQRIGLASLILGQNGVWGDLPAISKGGVDLFHEVLSAYKRVRDDITAADPYVVGRPGETFEVHEKIHASNGQGVVCLFAAVPGTYRYRIRGAAAGKATSFGPVVLDRGPDGVWATVTVARADSGILFFEQA